MPLAHKTKKKKPKSKEKLEKKKSGKKGVKENTEVDKKNDLFGDAEELTYTERALLDIRIKSLEEKLENRDKLIEKLRNETETYKIGYDEEVKDKEDTVAFLKRALRDRAVEITELQEKLIGIQQVHRKDFEKLDYRYNQLQAEYQQCKDRLTEENMLLTGKLSALEDFRVQKEDILNKLAETEAKLIERESYYRQELSRIEREVLENKEQLVQDVVHQVDKLAYEFRKASNDQMSFTVKKTIEENVHLRIQLKEASEKSMVLVRENQTLARSLKKCRDDLVVFKMTESKLATQFEALRKAYTVASAKIDKQKRELDRMNAIEFRLTTSDAENEEFEKKLKKLNEELEEFKSENTKLKLDLEEIRSKFADEYFSNNKLKSILNQSAKVIENEIFSTNKNRRGKIANNDLMQTLLDILVQNDTLLNKEENEIFKNNFDL